MLPVIGPIDTVNLFPELHAHLIDLLQTLGADDWQKPTACSPWSVKDVVAHLLDGQIRRLSFQRDRLPSLTPETAIRNQNDLIAFINQLNADWIRMARRISPPLLIEFLKLTGPQLHQFFKSVDPDKPAAISVAWAGDEVSPNWFDIAREYTEHWHHQQHIRDAVGQPGLTERRYLYPVLDTFMRAMPYTYRFLEADEGTTITVIITGQAGGEWSLQQQDGSWWLYHGAALAETARIRLDQDTAWRLFTRGMSLEAARDKVYIEGDTQLGAAILEMTSIMA